MSSKKPTSKTSKEKKKTPTKKSTSSKKSKKTIPQKWKEESKEVRRTLISTIKRSISLRGDKPETPSSETMNIVVTLSPAKHMDIIEYINENVAARGRAEWVRDSIRLKMRIERGIYGLNTGSSDEATKDSETLQTVFGQFAEVMTKVMTDLRDGQPTAAHSTSSAPTTATERRPRPAPSVTRSARGGPPQLKKVETDEKTLKEMMPDRPSLDDAIGAIIIVE
ncbi:MAG: hypothetical protein ACTSPM_03860 [Candidatus Heimdallarchaeota archaeon]